MDSSFKGAFPQPVAWRIVAADDEDSAAVAFRARAPEPLGVPPHHLRVVAAHLVRPASVGRRIVELVLRQPHVDGVHRPPVVPAPGEQVLAVGPKRVLQRAVAAAVVGHPPGVARKVVAPAERLLAEVRPDDVVVQEELPRRRHPRSAAVVHGRRRLNVVSLPAAAPEEASSNAWKPYLDLSSDAEFAMDAEDVSAQVDDGDDEQRCPSLGHCGRLDGKTRSVCGFQRLNLHRRALCRPVQRFFLVTIETWA
uniref:Uncharacterized protein n=1 Tax=Nymphaea colorata TaxID=210225 RepID=A0A5K1G3U2_9MAGN